MSNPIDTNIIRLLFRHEDKSLIHVDVDRRTPEGKDLLRWLTAHLGKKIA